MCTVLLRFDPSARWPLLLGAVRDEFVARPWDPPAAHWHSPYLLGGRDRTGGGTWLAVRTDRPAVSALLNGVRLPPRVRPTRGTLALSALTGTLPAADVLRDYDGFHLVLGTPTSVRVWSWDGSALTDRDLEPGDHIIVNRGVDTVDDPLVPHFLPLLRATPSPPLPAWDTWVELLRGDGLAPDDPAALIKRHIIDERAYGSTSASLVAVGADEVRFHFTATPERPAWAPVALPH